MAKVFIYAEKAAQSAELAGMAAGFGAESVLFAIGEAGDAASSGAGKVIVLKGASERPEDYAEAMADIVSAEGGALFAAVSTARGREVAAKVAARLGCGMASDASDLSLDADGLHAARSIYGGAVVERLSVPGCAVVTVAQGSYAPVDAPVAAEVEEREVQADTRVVRTGIEPVAKGGVDLTKADRVVGVGLGLEKQEDLALVDELAGVLGAAVGCTRDVAEGRGWLPKEQYIGITGAQIKPQLYIGIGLSGAMQHVFGIRDAKVVVGINKAKDAPIFRAADYGIVGDLYDVVPKLVEALK